MHRSGRISAAFAVVGLASAVLVAGAKTPKPIEVTDKVTLEATVEAIDRAERTLTLKGSKGNVVTVAVDEAVTRFDQVQVGDRVTVNYYESVLVEVYKPGEAPPEDTVVAGVVALEGDKPSGVGGIQETTTVTIEAIDTMTPAVTVRTAEGDSLSYRVRDKKNLKHAAVGDQVVVTRTVALAVDVTAGKK